MADLWYDLCVRARSCSPRLSYEDWIGPREPARAELIRIQCMVTEERAAHFGREAELLYRFEPGDGGTRCDRESSHGRALPRQYGEGGAVEANGAAPWSSPTPSIGRTSPRSTISVASERLCSVVRMVRLPDGARSVLVEGRCRARSLPKERISAEAVDVVRTTNDPQLLANIIGANVPALDFGARQELLEAIVSNALSG